MQGVSSQRDFVAIRHNAVPGRVRFDVRGLYRSPQLANLIRRSFAPGGDVRVASTNVSTGTVLLQCEGSCDPDDLCDALEAFVKGAVERAARDDQGPDTASPSVMFGQTSGVSRDEDWHAIPAEQTLARLDTSRSAGLDTALVTRHRRQFGLNQLPQSEPLSAFKMFTNQLKGGPVALLAGSAVLSILTGGLADAALITGVMLVNGAIGYATESRAERVIRSLDQEDHGIVKVLRNGVASEITASELVPGDIVMLSAGRVPADIRLLEAKHLTVDESALTGESSPAKKSVKRLDITTPLADRGNMLYSGTVVTGGSARGVVVATGLNSEIGRLQALVGTVRSPETPLQRNLRLLGDQTVALASVVCGSVFLIGLWRGMAVLDILRTAISLAIAAVPEGLPAIGTTTLAFGVTRMRAHNVLVRRLHAVESLGAVEMLCFDKTGTLTLNLMTVTRVFAAMREYRVREGQILLDGSAIDASAHHELIALARVGLLCNETRVDTFGGDTTGVTLDGSPTEVALMRLAIVAGLDLLAERQSHPLRRTKLRSEAASYMATEHELPVDDGRRLVAVKGRPDEIVRRSTRYLKDGAAHPLGPDEARAFLDANERLASKALRVLALAYRDLDAEDEYADNDLILLGLVGLKDPPRAGMRDLIAAFHAAGIRTRMMTGDQPQTATALGRELNFPYSTPLKTIDAQALASIDENNFADKAADAQVFARVSPTDKLRIVRALQRGRRVVAMTGDGINDSPALKAADIGIAMGNGTQAARDAADVVLADDNLQTMLEAIRQGRSIRDNLGKAVRFLLATNLSEILVTLGGVLLGGQSPLTPSHLLWINILTDVFPALGLALEPPAPDVLQRMPAPAGMPLFSQSDLTRLGIEAAMMASGSLGVYAHARRGRGRQDEARAKALAFMALTVAQILYTHSARTKAPIFMSGSSDLPANPHVRGAVAFAAVAQILAVSIPTLRRLLKLEPLTRRDWGPLLWGSLSPLIGNEGIKILSQRHLISRPITFVGQS